MTRYLMIKKTLTLIISALIVSGCATIVNDANVPVSLSFADGSQGTCKLTNKRGSWTANLPETVMIRRSDDALRYDCETNAGKRGFGSIPSGMEGGKMAASVFFWDLGITDAITDKHRTYPASFVVPVK
tara:strand:- start:377 stop:763 length:387 start_codon:yes stop_codon:yes gene_type:complete